jgi:hypothetical protein
MSVRWSRASGFQICFAEILFELHSTVYLRKLKIRFSEESISSPTGIGLQEWHSIVLLYRTISCCFEIGKSYVKYLWDRCQASERKQQSKKGEEYGYVSNKISSTLNLFTYLIHSCQSISTSYPCTSQKSISCLVVFPCLTVSLTSVPRSD